MKSDALLHSDAAGGSAVYRGGKVAPAGTGGEETDRHPLRGRCSGGYSKRAKKWRRIQLLSGLSLCAEWVYISKDLPVRGRRPAFFAGTDGGGAGQSGKCGGLVCSIGGDRRLYGGWILSYRMALPRNRCGDGSSAHRAFSGMSRPYARPCTGHAACPRCNRVERG